jgi:protein-S-isoprenylcysteine O-methyltransferase Ste14
MSHSSSLDAFGFAVFLMLTILRQGTHLLHLRYRMRGKANYQHIGDSFSTTIMYVLYFVIWIGSIFSYIRNGTEVSYFLAGITLLLAGTWLRYLGVKALGGNFASKILIWHEHQLVTTGIYSYFRHPIHLALLLELSGMVVIAPAATTATALAAIIIVVIWRNQREDNVLMAFFGSKAKHYCQSVPGMNPLPMVKHGLADMLSRTKSGLAR